MRTYTYVHMYLYDIIVQVCLHTNMHTLMHPHTHTSTKMYIFMHTYSYSHTNALCTLHMQECAHAHVCSHYARARMHTSQLHAYTPYVSIHGYMHHCALN